MKTRETIISELPYFTGTESYYRTMFPRVVVSDGVHYVREACDAYWLIDAICTHLLGREKKDDFSSIQLVVKNQIGELTLDDGNGNIFARQTIGFTDFPLDAIRFYGEFDGARWVLILPGEH